MNREQAQERIEEIRGFWGHLASYIAVNGFLLAINVLNWEGELWVVYPMLGWGIGLAIHAFTTFGTGAAWEERKMQELTGWSATQEELEKLSERTDNLVTILSSINWEKIDPELVETKEQLSHAQANIVRLQDGPDSGLSKEDVVREIEKLEEFVTSPKFQFYDKAQSS